MTLRCQAELYLSQPRTWKLTRCLCQTSLHHCLSVAGGLPEVPVSLLDSHRRKSMIEMV